MPHKPWAANDFIINDRKGLTYQANCTILSLLRGGIGLPGAAATLAQRVGLWPFVGGLGRPGNRLDLTTYFLTATPALQRRALLAELNPELEKLARLTVTDTIPPEGVIAAFGPWDIYEGDESTPVWHCRSVLWGRAGSGDLTPCQEADITGAIHFEDGLHDRQRAIVIEAGTTNVITNPSVETDQAGWVAGGISAVVTREAQTWAAFGESVLCIVTKTAADQLERDISGEATADATYTATIYLRGQSDTALYFQLFGNTSGITSTVIASDTLDDTWQRFEVSHTFVAGDTTRELRIRQQFVSGEADFYADGAQLEQADYSTSYCDGSLGPGIAWSGTAHASSSTRTDTLFTIDDYASTISEKDTLTFRLVVKMPYDSAGPWPTTNNFFFDAIGATGNDRIALIYSYVDPGTDQWRVYLNGDYRIDAPLAFSAGDWLDIIVTVDFGNNSYQIFVNNSLIGSDTTSLSTPTLTKWRLGCDQAGGAFHSHARHAEYMVWDRVLTVEEINDLYINGPACGRARYQDVLCEISRPVVIGVESNRGNTSTLAVNDEVRWRSRDGDVSSLNVDCSGRNHIVTVDSDDDVYPIIRLIPRTAKAPGNEGYAYKRWCPVVWNTAAITEYPIALNFATGPGGGTPIGDGKMQADGDDLRVWVDGVEVDRWLNGINTASTNVWINLDWEETQSATLTSDMGAGDTVTEIEVDDDISGFPASGILLIDSEAFTYTGRNKNDKKFTGVTRATKGTSAAAHTGGVDIVYWIQHDIFIYYGNATIGAPTVDSTKEPIIELTSSNTSWVYQEFGNDDRTRTGQWTPSTAGQGLPGSGDDPRYYTANRDTEADPWQEMGGITPQYYESVRWRIYNPCGITNANFTNGEKMAFINRTYWQGYIESSADGSVWTSEYTIPVPAANNVWEAWSRNEAITANMTYVSLHLDNQQNITGPFYLEAADCTLTIGPDNPTVSVNAEQSNYTLAVTLTNATTGDAITMEDNLELDKTLEIDTRGKTVTYIADGSSRLAGLTVNGDARRDWLRLIRGDNTVNYTDDKTQGVDMTIQWHRRDWE